MRNTQRLRLGPPCWVMPVISATVRKTLISPPIYITNRVGSATAPHYLFCRHAAAGQESGVRRIVAALSVPKLESLASLHRLAPSTCNAEHRRQQFACGICAKLARGRDDGFSKYNEPSVLAERSTEDDFLGAVVGFVESADGEESGARAEHETPCRQAIHPE